MLPRPFLLLPLLLLVAGGCATYGLRMEPVLRALRREEYGTALRRLEKKPEEKSVLWQMEHGLLLRCAGRLRESTGAFAVALDRQDELFTRSVSNEAAALAVSDVLRPYRANEYEVPFLRLYPMLNYLDLGETEGALVEARALSQLLEERRSEDDAAAADWGLGRLLCGFCFEAGGDWNNAWIAYRAAQAAYLAQAGPPEILDFCRAGMERNAVLLGLADGAQSPRGGGAHLVLWVEHGLVPAAAEVHLRVPILKEEEDWKENRLDQWSRRVGDRALCARHGGHAVSEVEVSYLVDVALPVLPPPGDPEPAQGRGAAQILAGLDGFPLRRTLAYFPAEDLDQRTRDDFDRRMPGIAARAAPRALIKALATRAVRRGSGEVVGTIANLLGVVTEQADTRSWSTLPAAIGLAYCELPPGRAEIEVEDPRGSRPSARISLVLPPGGWRFLTCRFLH